MSRPRTGPADGEPARARLVRSFGRLALQFRGEVTQSRMWRWAPDLLEVGYTRTMLAGLLLHPRPRRIGAIGLGGGSQVKFLYRHLPQARIEVAEIDPAVLALRRDFRIPQDNARLRIDQADGACWITGHQAAFDLLLVDAYDPDGIPPALATRRFHQDCHAALAEGGILASNLYATDVKQHLARLRQAFDGQVRVINEVGMSNRVAFAWRGRLPAFDLQRAAAQLPFMARWQALNGMQRLARALPGAENAGP